MKKRSFSYSAVLVTFHFLSLWHIRPYIFKSLICMFGKVTLGIAKNVELLPFKNGEDNSVSASTIDRGLTPLILT